MNRPGLKHVHIPSYLRASWCVDLHVHSIAALRLAADAGGYASAYTRLRPMRAMDDRLSPHSNSA
jgi:hypothetical protein